MALGVSGKGYPRDLVALLRDLVRQVNQQEPFAFQVREQVHPGRHYFSFVPTRTRNRLGQTIEVASYLDAKVTMPLRTARVVSLAADLSRALERSVGRPFACCETLVAGVPWGMNSVAYQASDRAAREVLEDLIDKAGVHQSYSVMCEPFSQSACFISLHEVSADRKPRSDGVCNASGYEP
jgi:hypothetical protein